jgi:hypothetical protein
VESELGVCEGRSRPHKKEKSKTEHEEDISDVSADEDESSKPNNDNSDVHKIASHPSDVVFYYDEPYSVNRTYVNTDLKSYKRGSITARAIGSAIQNLALTLECAELSDEWREKFVHDDKSYKIIGLLFIYNHDGDYDLGFDEIIAKVNHENLNIPRNSRIFVLGPRDIRWLDNVRLDIISLRGLNRLPHED